MKKLVEYIPVAAYSYGGYSTYTGPHGPRTYASLESALMWRTRHGRDHLWKILELTIEDGQEPTARWVA